MYEWDMGRDMGRCLAATNAAFLPRSSMESTESAAVPGCTMKPAQ